MIMKILIAGLGSIGRRHFGNLVSLGETDIVLLRTHKPSLPDDELAGYPVEIDIHDALEKHLPEARRVAPLSQKALLVLKSTPGVSCVLVGMRSSEYVEDALGMMAWEPLSESKLALASTSR